MSETMKIMEHSLGYYIREYCKRYDKSIALSTMGSDKQFHTTTYRQLYNNSLAWAAILKEKGVKTGDRVAIIASKCQGHFAFFYACWYLGAIGVPVCETLGEDETAFILGDSDPALIIADKNYLKKALATCNGKPVVALSELPWNGEKAEETEPVETDLDAVAALIYTSGSTGMPKGVMLTHKNLFTNAYWAMNAFDVTSSDSMISLLPYWHSYGLTCEILAVISVGATCLVPRDIKDFQLNLAAYQPTIMIAVPRVIETVKQKIDKAIAAMPPKKKALIDKAIYNASRIFTATSRLDGGILRMLTHHIFYDPLVFRQFRKRFGGKLRFVVVGGAPMDLEVLIFFKFMGIVTLVGYGLTETSPVICANNLYAHKLGTCGQVMGWLKPENGGDFTFKDEEGHIGKEVTGQLLVKGDCVMKGYWRHTDASAKSFEDGWLNTGDIGYCDEDGYITIQGRKGNMIVMYNGEKMHPEHIEDAVKNSEYITDAMVIGEKCKNVYICVNVDAEKFAGKSDEEIHDILKGEVQKYTNNLANFQKPRDVLVLPKFCLEDGTLTATLKIRRFKIKELYKDKIEAFLLANGEEIATQHEVKIAYSKIKESMNQP